MKSDERTWEKLGKIAPYYSVLTAEEFKPENLSAENLTAFFDSGREHMARLIEIVRELSPEFAPGTAVDFGCGVGRTTIPLAEISSMVIAVDIAAEMLRQAGKNCEARHLTNVTFLTTEAFFQLPAGSVNFVHSFIVLQHVPVSEGYQIIAKLISILGNGGIGAIHVTFGDDRPRLRRLLSWIKIHLPGVAQLQNLLQRRPADYPSMRMYSYNLDRLFCMLHEGGCHKVKPYFTDHGRHLGVFLIFEKSALESF